MARHVPRLCPACGAPLPRAGGCAIDHEADGARGRDVELLRLAAVLQRVAVARAGDELRARPAAARAA